jgi:hypothetical protein
VRGRDAGGGSHDKRLERPPRLRWGLLAVVALLVVVAATPAAALAGYRDVVLGDGPVGYWRLGEPPGATTAADSAASNNGTYRTV